MNSTAPVDFRSTAGDELFAFEMVEVRINAAFAKGNVLFGLELNGFYDFVAIHLLSGEEFQHEQFRDTVEKGRVSFGHRRGQYLLVCGIVKRFPHRSRPYQRIVRWLSCLVLHRANAPDIFRGRFR